MASKERVQVSRNDTVTSYGSQKEPPGKRQGPIRHRRTINPIRMSLLCLSLAGIFVLCAVVIGRLIEYREARLEYEVYASVTEEPTPSPALETATPMPNSEAPAALAASASVSATPTPEPRRFYSGKVSAFRRDNKDTVGWLEIPGTRIAYPLVQTDNNEYYVEHTFAKKRNSSGAIFLDCWNAADFSDFNSIIYGHNMKDGSMFAELREYESQSFADDHPSIQVTQYDAQRTYQVFAAYISQGEDNFRGQGCVLERDRAAFLNEAKRRSIIKTEVAVNRDDRLLTLATCTSGRHPWYFVVHAVLVEEQLWAE